MQGTNPINQRMGTGTLSIQPLFKPQMVCLLEQTITPVQQEPEPPRTVPVPSGPSSLTQSPTSSRALPGSRTELLFSLPQYQINLLVDDVSVMVLAMIPVGQAIMGNYLISRMRLTPVTPCTSSRLGQQLTAPEGWDAVCCRFSSPVHPPQGF